MTFGAMAAWQAWLLIAATAAAAVALFLIKVRPPRVSVPSLLLWRRVLDHARAMTWWERVRRAVSLVATAIIAVALAVALTRPVPGAAAAGSGRVLIVLDSSWSMLGKTSNGRTRWDRAVSQAHALAASAGGEAVALATTADGLVEAPTTDLALVETALDRLRPSGGETAGWPRVSGGATMHFFTDGAIARELDPAVIVHSVFEAAPNVAITAFDARPAAVAGAVGEAYIELANYSAAPQDARLRLTRGGQSILDKSITIGAGQVIHTAVDVPEAGGPELRARLSAPLNAMEIDDEAVAWIPETIAVTVVGDDRGPLANLLRSAPGLEINWTTPAAYRPGSEDVVVFQKWVPATAPSRPLLVVEPPASSWLGQFAAEEKQLHWSRSVAHPVLLGVDPLTVDIKKARSFSGPGLDVIASSDRGTPIVLVGDTRDRRIVVVTPGLAVAESNLSMAPAFPVMIGNSIEWLANSGVTGARHPGQVSLPKSTAKVTAPDGRDVKVSVVGESALATLSQPGVYTVESAGSKRRISVNVGEPRTSDLLRTSMAGGGSGASAAAPSSRPWWLYALVTSFVLLLTEWWTWQRRITV